MKFILVRHGETHSNTLFGTPEQLLIGALDNKLTELNDTGLEQARLAHTKVKEYVGDSIDEIYVSDLTRTIQTADIVFEGYSYHKEPRLRERTLGILEGMLLSDVVKNEELNATLPDSRYEEFEACMSKKHPSGESYEDVALRLKDFLSQFNYEDNKTVACVSHFHTLRLLIYLLLDKPFDMKMFDMMLKNSDPYVFEYVDGKFVLVSDNLDI